MQVLTRKSPSPGLRDPVGFSSQDPDTLSPVLGMHEPWSVALYRARNISRDSSGIACLSEGYSALWTMIDLYNRFIYCTVGCSLWMMYCKVQYQPLPKILLYSRSRISRARFKFSGLVKQKQTSSDNFPIVEALFRSANLALRFRSPQSVLIGWGNWDWYNVPVSVLVLIVACYGPCLWYSFVARTCLERFIA